MKLKTMISGALVSLILLISPAFSQINLDWDVLSSGGTDASSAVYQLDATIGQTATVFTSGGPVQNAQGYWNGIGGCCITPIRGDLNLDGTDANILDLTFAVDRIFRGGPPPVCGIEGDANSDGAVCNILDLTFLVDRIFRGGPLPGAC